MKSKWWLQLKNPRPRVTGQYELDVACGNGVFAWLGMR